MKRMIVLLTLVFTLAGCASAPPANGGDPKRFANDPARGLDRHDVDYGAMDFY